ncbi:cupredoxin domain-containing protein [Methylibium sp.]|uniref:cupredoxin domain-containing protein n=1 Tax=Methylibium sp. TaxID=2067992 RepID=UPI003D0A26D1
MNYIHRLLAISLVALGSAAFAHGDDDHAKTAGGHVDGGHASALGKPGDPKKVTRTVEITMSDAMRFSPPSVAVKRNETIRFMLKNQGKVKHEMVLGTIKELKEHAALMLKFPEMEHADPNQASVEAGKTGELVWQFTKTGTFDFACLQPGHYEAGMKGQVVVAGTATPVKADGHGSHQH